MRVNVGKYSVSFFIEINIVSCFDLNVKSPILNVHFRVIKAKDTNVFI